MTISWPSSLDASRCVPELRNFTVSGGRTFGGREQRIFSNAGFWEISYTIPLNTRAKVHAYRAMIARLRGGEDIFAKIFDKHRPGLFGDSTATLGADAALGATTLDIDWSDDDLFEGQHFRIGNRLYRITELTDNVGPGKNFNFLPPLRSAALTGATVNMDTLHVRSILFDMDSGDLDLSLLRVGEVSLTLIESV